MRTRTPTETEPVRAAHLQDRVDLLLDQVEHQSGLRRVAVHLLGIGTAAEFSWENHPQLHRAEILG